VKSDELKPSRPVTHHCLSHASTSLKALSISSATPDG